MMLFAYAAALLGVVVAIAHYIIGDRVVLQPLFREQTGGILAAKPMRDLTWAMFQLHSLVWATLGVAVLVNRWQGGSDLVGYLAILIFTVSGLGNLLVLRRPHPGGIMLLLAAAASAADIIFN
ncbi:MAG: hypothetical protein GW808_02410 [Sphingomonadales bacterium]|nr:hypothetical protein [Sphingomonadales bacterium]PIX64671.1 MAG: hypothetical protein COZ43_11190 [Sphingomonadales bacterium CG_4_10_14_3_um_filter_58_15]NCO48435.1 hypothetical protein [Sphingomonadales bacterium]NCO99251.1 hypothetical protein [Sphingomonadales bacterium]NCP27699.1 hypothetical protein [Sphingomonadales bacterium]